MAKNENVKNGIIFPVGKKNDAYTQYFTGQSYLKSLIADPAASVKHWHGATKDSWFEHIAITAGKTE